MKQEISHTKLQETVQAGVRKCMPLNAFIIKQEILKINGLNTHFKKL